MKIRGQSPEADPVVTFTKFISTRLAVAAVGLILPEASAAHYKLFVLTGQSNSLGTTNGGEADPTSGSDPADSHVEFFWSNLSGSGAAVGDSGGVFTTLQDQQGFGSSATYWGPEIEFARNLYRAGVRNFGVIKASRGGGGNSYWLKGSADDHMYDHVVSTVATATADLTSNGHTFEIVGLLYLQGESDSPTEAAAAGTRLKTLTDNLRVDLPGAAAMRTVAAGITYAGSATDDTTRANQAAIAASTSYIDYFDNTDLQDRLAPDGIHLNKAAKIVVGNRFGQTFMNVGTVDRHYGKLVFIGDSITQGGNGNPSYRYQVFTNLANQGVPINSAAGYEFVGSVSGAYQSNAGTTPDVNGQVFGNHHDGHWGWRAFWENGRVALPSGRRSNNRGEGTILNWTGQVSPQEYDLDTLGNKVSYPDSGASGTGNTGVTYIPDSAVIMIGINDLAGGSAPTQVRDDVGTMIDQLQAANANVSIYLSEVLHTDQGAALQADVDTFNGLLPALATSKTTATSSVWLIPTGDGFDPAAMTYDSVHPNTAGETHVGDRISGGMGIIEMPDVVVTDPVVPLVLEEKAGDRLGCSEYEGSDIWNTGSYVNDWTVIGSFDTSAVGENDLRLNHPGGSGDTLDGTNTEWSDINDGPWTLEATLKFDANPNGFILWLGTGTDRILIEIHGDRTQDLGGDSFNVAHNNLDGQFHTWKVQHDPSASVYHLWRDGVLLTPVAGAPYDQGNNDQRLLLGDYTGGTFGDGFDVTIDEINFCGGFEGNQIYDGTGFINGWGEVGTINPVLVNTTDLNLENTVAGGSWLEGTNSGWSDLADGIWTMEARLKFDANPSGYVMWLGTVDNLILIDVFADRTEDRGGNVFSVSHNNVDGQFHTFRVGHDPDNEVYHMWRDGERLTPVEGAPYDSASNDSRMIFGDSTSGGFGNDFDVTVDYIRTDTGNVYLPVGADTDGDGMPDLWEETHFGGITDGVAGDDDDGDGQTNLEEYQADTDPLSASSSLEISSILTDGSEVDVTVPDSSASRVYVLEESNDLGQTDAWEDIGVGEPGNGGDLLLEDPSPASDRRFYRVRVMVP